MRLKRMRPAICTRSSCICSFVSHLPSSFTSPASTRFASAVNWSSRCCAAAACLLFGKVVTKPPNAAVVRSYSSGFSDSLPGATAASAAHASSSGCTFSMLAISSRLITRSSLIVAVTCTFKVTSASVSLRILPSTLSPDFRMTVSAWIAAQRQKNADTVLLMIRLAGMDASERNRRRHGRKEKMGGAVGALASSPAASHCLRRTSSVSIANEK